LLAELKTQTQAAIADIRRLVYDLRPPALDQLGLVSALRERAAQYGGVLALGDRPGQANGLYVSVEAPEALPPAWP
ncbi:MAG: two-component sensor histidine kinase, partial [Chloroflexi bacterium]|nr:two-component sensor histidine kinase [Chloroflexota bacterium]